MGTKVRGFDVIIILLHYVALFTFTAMKNKEYCGSIFDPFNFTDQFYCFIDENGREFSNLETFPNDARWAGGG